MSDDVSITITAALTKLALVAGALHAAGRIAELQDLYAMTARLHDIAIGEPCIGPNGVAQACTSSTPVPTLVDTHGRVIRSPETEAEIAALKARIAELEGRTTPSTAKTVVAKSPQFIDVNEHSYVAAHIDGDDCPRCDNGTKLHPQLTADGSGYEADHCTICKCSWWHHFPSQPTPEMIRPRKTKAVDDNTPIIAGMSKQVILTSTVEHAPVMISADDVAVFAGVGSEANYVARTFLNPSAETWEQKRERIQREAFTKAKKIAAKDYTGWVWWPGVGEDGFFESVDELRTCCQSNGVPVPTWVWACTPEPLKLDADGILDQALEEHFEGARGNISDAEEARLQVFLNEWAAAQEIVSWHKDNSRAVIL